MLRIGAILAIAGALSAPFVCRGAIIQTEVSPINGHTYHLLSQSNWTDAEAEAIKLGGHLATVRSQVENDWVWNTFNPLHDRYLWIGLSTPGVLDPSAYAWASGESSAYRNWAGSEPSDTLGDEYYVQMGYEIAENLSGWNNLWNQDSWVKPLHGVVEIVPEPSTLALAGMAIAGLAVVAARRRRVPL